MQVKKDIAHSDHFRKQDLSIRPLPQDSFIVSISASSEDPGFTVRESGRFWYSDDSGDRRKLIPVREF
jgi:hypothetical protein